MIQETYHIKLNQFEGPFDLLLFFIQRDELDINNIPIHTITTDFLDYLHQMEKMNIELASEFILFVAILMKIKSSSILPRKPLDEDGNEIDLKGQLQERLIEYKKIKEASEEISKLEKERIMLVARGNVREEESQISQLVAENTELESITTYRLIKAFERVLKKFADRNFKPTHTVVTYNYTSKETRTYLLEITSFEEQTHFDKVFQHCENRLHAIYIFLAVLELTEEKFLEIMVGERANDFYIKKKPETHTLTEIQAS